MIKFDTAFSPRAAALLLILLAPLGLAGCAEPARPTALVASATETTLITAGNPLFKALAVGAIGGGRETGVIEASQVSGPSFREGLDTSLSLRLMKTEGSPAFTVDATIIEVDQPSLQINFTATATVLYEVRNEIGAIVFSARVTTESTAEVTDSIIRQERIRIATEGAARENIKQFLEVLAAESTRAPNTFAQG